MFMRAFGGERIVLVLVLGLGLSAFGASAVAEESYRGDDFCVQCHADKYETYIRHGHPWKLYHADRQQPPDNLYPWGDPLPQLPANKTWGDIEYILRGSKGKTFYLIGTDGKLMKADGSAWINYSCGKCHTTGYTEYDQNDPDPAHHQLGLAGIKGTWALEGIQCEACHGPGETMWYAPWENAKACQDCHTGDDAKRRVAFTVAPAGQEAGFFTAKHPQGDEFDRSPHKNLGCVLCHDPHKSVWNDDGGVKYSEEGGAGHMCTTCHNKRVRGVMRDVGIECVDCHMPERSEGVLRTDGSGLMEGHRATHLFRINTTPLAAEDNTFQEDNKTWWNTDQNGESFLTLDLVCGGCHNRPLGWMAAKAVTIHRSSEMLDLTVNGDDRPLAVKRSDLVSVDFSVEAGDKNGMKAQWWVICQTPKGWSSWNGKKWKAGLRPWRKNAALVDVPERNVLKSRLKPGFYTYWVGIYPSDDSENVVSVPVYVKKR